MLRLSYLALAVLPTVASAEAAYEWGEGSAGPCRVEIQPCEGDCVAQVTFTNELVFPALLAVHAALANDRIAVSVIVVPSMGDVPDTFTVVPPVGYYAEPAEVVVEEGEAAVIRVLPVPMG